MANIAQLINLGPQDLNLALNTPLAAAGAAVTSGILDLQSIAPNGDAWRLGRIAIVVPALPENNDITKSITVDLQAANASLVAGNPAGVAPNTPPPAAFATPLVAQKLSVTGVAVAGSAANIYYMTLAFDPNGNPFQFYQFVITTPAGIVTQAENILIAWVDA